MSNRTDGRLSEELERTLYVANLDDRVTDEILYELMIQAGPVDYVTRPKDRPFGFVVFEHEESVPYSIALLRNVRLFDRTLDIRPRDGTEQARKINDYMNEVREKRRRMTALDNGDDKNRRSSGDWQQQMAPISMAMLSNQTPHRGYGSAHSSPYSAGHSRNVSYGDYESSRRSASWSELATSGGDHRYRDHTPLVPPPPLPPMPPPPSPYFPSRGDQRGGSGIRDFSLKRRHDDRRYDIEDDEASPSSYRYRGSGDCYRFRDDRDQRDDRYDNRGRYDQGGNRYDHRDDRYRHGGSQDRGGYADSGNGWHSRGSDRR